MSAFEEYTCMDGDTLDLIAFERFGVHGMEPAILEANPGLADLGYYLPLGHVVRIPVPMTVRKATTGRLWD